MAEWKRISPLDIVWQGFRRVCAERRGCMAAVLKCRVSINGVEGRVAREEDGCRSVLSDNGVSLGVAVRGVEGRNVSSQQAGVVTSECQTNKLLTLTNTWAARGYS